MNHLKTLSEWNNSDTWSRNSNDFQIQGTDFWNELWWSWGSKPSDFVTNMTQINNQSDLISMSSIAGPSYLTIRSSVYMILISDPCIFNLSNLFQTGFSDICRKPHQCSLHFNEHMTSTQFLLLWLHSIKASKLHWNNKNLIHGWETTTMWEFSAQGLWASPVFTSFQWTNDKHTIPSVMTSLN